MEQDRLRELLVELKQEVIRVGDFMEQHFGQVRQDDVEEKGKNSLVSFVDKEAEQMLVSFCEQAVPGCGFLTEEETVNKKGDRYTWIIDPLDGTTNYLYGIPTFAVSIALQEHDKTILGIVYEVIRKECFYSIRGESAYLNEQKIQVSDRSGIETALIATGFPYSEFEFVDRQMKFMQTLIHEARGIRRIGTAAVDLAYVACGRFDVYFEAKLNPWDVAAGMFIVEQAGGNLSDFDGNDPGISGRELIASSVHMRDDFMHLFKKSFA
ncbi:MAG: inositol monophosphatase family protein [Saprospiraceae bacterium]|nr:inositol monophosphatase family protein [Saprospiraceae bacterium]